jgi:hypothetical protein
VIRTTGEHPFFALNQGWIPARNLTSTDFIRTDSGWIGVTEIDATGEWTTVYNLRVSDWHTYFVKEDAWNEGIWAHNAYLTKTERIAYNTSTSNPVDAHILAVAFEHRLRTKTTPGRNVAVVAVQLPTGQDEFWAASSSSPEVIRYRISSLGEVERTGTFLITLANIQSMPRGLISATGFNGIHSEEVLMVALTTYAANNSSAGKLHLDQIYSELALCGGLTGSHRCSSHLEEWSRHRQIQANISIDTEKVQYSQLYPDYPASREFHMSFHERISRAVLSGNRERANMLGNYYYDRLLNPNLMNPGAAINIEHFLWEIPRIGIGVQWLDDPNAP